ncbi:hypothetical protein [Clostridium estertheticum]|uniref:Uncharacterized protein n=1 Tax=Clostridium estertheticum TaxID=238834 RepID=A0A7Y3WUX3_9CLOT|nr:hypothetical protein [Clostridium estertheticum]MBW9173998.1 hypothetical protein [Clostridium estertheticum]NNU78538.1 hypothetical protein [Clostridium estertheticum]WBL49602.1 hypothetical protein LOR37_23145 [Clostridium estertheticum]WLC77768.1 hypothetical protein KTC99_23315 [Clostridium estertheticum]
MKKQISNDLILNTLLLLKEFINNNCKLNLKVSVTSTKGIVSKVDNNMFYEAGKLLMLFFIVNVNNLQRKNIKYAKETFYIINSPVNNIAENYIKNPTSENIITDIIYKSTYNKEVLPIEITSVTSENLNELKKGFELVYKTIINEKTNLINFLQKCEFRKNYLTLIKDIKLLSPHDLKVQLQFIELKYSKNLIKNELLEKVICCKNNYDEFISASNEFLDLLIENATIGFGENGLELMWIGYIDERLEAIKYKNIYIAIFFAYIGKVTANKYYLQTTKHCVNSLLTNVNDDEKLLYNDEYYEMLKLLYLLNNSMELDYKALDKVIEKNTKLFDLIDFKSEIKYSSNKDEIMLEFICNKSLDILHFVILEPVSI